MKSNKLVSALCALALGGAACSGAANEDETARSASSAESPTQSAAADSAMAGMDHSTMTTADSSVAMGAMDHGATAPAGASGMAGMDHSQMTAATGTATPMVGTDHSQMARATPGSATAMAGMNHAAPAAARMGSATAMTAADHAAMSRTAPAGSMPAHQQATTRTGSGVAPAVPMDHSAMTRTASDPRANANTSPAAAATDHTQHTSAEVPSQGEGADPGMEKLKLLVSELVDDPVVQQRIRADTALSRRWEDEGVRQALEP